MPDTARSWPCSLREAAVQRALEQIGRREIAENQGPIVDWAVDGLPVYNRMPRWCAYFACQCYRRELLQRGDEALLQHWLRIASGSCDTLWMRLTHEGWAWERVGGPPPARGDFFFLGGAEDLNHTGLVTEYDGRRRLVRTVEGNNGDAVARERYGLADKRIWGFARVPW